MPPITIVVEGDSDLPVAYKVLALAGLQPGVAHDKAGKHQLDQKLSGYLAAAAYSPWFILRDLDHDEPCAPMLLDRLGVSQSTSACVRVPVRSVESWLLADAERIAAFLAVPVGLVPANPDSEVDPKRSIVDLSRRSSKKTIRRGMLARPGSGRHVGPLFEQLIIDFGTHHWRPSVARKHSPSLDRCIKALQRARSERWADWF